MPSGGVRARARAGPPPNPNSLRSAGEFTILPAEGRQGRPPKWPLVDPSPREMELWRVHWRMPQATQWERNGQVLEVAMYVRRFAEAEVPGASVGLGTLVRQQQEALGISIPGMLRNRWLIGEPPAREEKRSRTAAKGSSVRERFQVVAGGGD